MAVDSSNVKLLARRLETSETGLWDDNCRELLRVLKGHDPEDAVLLFADHRLNISMVHLTVNEDDPDPLAKFEEQGKSNRELNSLLCIFRFIDNRTWEFFEIFPGRYLLTFPGEEYLEFARISQLVHEHCNFDKNCPITMSVPAGVLVDHEKLIETFEQSINSAGYWAVGTEAVSEAKRLIRDFDRNDSKPFGVCQITSLVEPTYVALVLKGLTRHVNLTFTNDP